MATLSSLTQPRLQSVVGSVPSDTGIGASMFAIERGKRIVVDVPAAIIGATVLWVGVLNPGLWSVVQLPVIWILVLLVYLFGGGWI